MTKFGESPADDVPDNKAASPPPYEQKPAIKLTGEDAPEPGSIYVITETTTKNALTNENGRIVLSGIDTGKPPPKSQKWVCCRSAGWLGFTNDAGSETTWLGHDAGGILICTAKRHQGWEHFCVRKRGEKGFEIMVRHWDGMQPLGYRRDSSKLGKGDTSDTWWSFTKVC